MRFSLGRNGREWKTLSRLSSRPVVPEVEADPSQVARTKVAVLHKKRGRLDDALEP
jgi:hypothetical protein